jgi:hypothetical protein
MKRTIPFSPQHTITKNGRVWKSREAIAPFTAKGKFGMVHLAVTLDGQRQFIWQLLVGTWYNNAMILTRDGGLLNWDESNVFTLKLGEKSIWADTNLIPEVQWIWWQYQHERIPCVSMSDVSGLKGYSVDEYRSLVTDILKSSVR